MTKKIRIHTVRNPFLCREGQFVEGERTLCVGLDSQALKAYPIFKCFLGTSQKKSYEIESAHAMEVGQPWANPAGRTVFIVPLKEFKMQDLTPDMPPMGGLSMGLANLPKAKMDELREKLHGKGGDKK